MKSVVVTGATSMLGISLINECIRNGVKVLAIVRKSSKKTSKLPKSDLITILECNIDDYSLINCKENYDVLFHLAWSGTSKEERCSEKVQEKNIQYSIDAVRLAKKLNCKRFIGIGSQAEYGVCDERLDSTNEEKPVTAYGKAKLIANYETRKEAKNLEIDHIWIRVLSIYGKNDNSNTMIMKLLNCIKNNENIDLTYCEQKWDYLYSDDAGEAIFLIGKKGISNKIYNLGSGTCRVLKEYVEIIKRITKSNIKINYGAIPYSKNQVMYLCADITDITRDTGWIPKTVFEDGIISIISI